MLNDRRPVVSEMNEPSTLNSQLSTIPQFVWRIADVIVGGVFIYAGAIKVLDPIRFANDIENYKILPWTIGVGLAFYLPWLEIFCGLALILRRLYLGGLTILTALISAFLVATIAAKIRGLDITCGCFGHVSQRWNFSAHLALDLPLLAALILLLFRPGRDFRLA
ncbi:MAG: DoxX family protein [Verrucomicrobia bacterium]|nr:MAG: DoxX family protein [Verrucomicrobiota bacterium]